MTKHLIYCPETGGRESDYDVKGRRETPAGLPHPFEYLGCNDVADDVHNDAPEHRLYQ